ncbi:MAG: ABC transporter ATP-binding protein, partial [Rikenellaceae bacterium]|nr:ABC transporter ATP-binding protein [Rikenellaceae bacterium]
MKTEAIIQADALTIGYRLGGGKAKTVQSGLSFALERGTLTALLGLNGSGKSTLLRTLSAAQPPLSGTILLDGKPFEAYSARELSRQIGVVLTDKIHAGGLRVREMVALGRHPYSGFFGRLSAEDEAIVARSMEQATIAHKEDSYIAELSDGERQKAMIAKALAQECPVILLDEPTAFLDVVSRIEVMKLLHALTRHGKTILLSTHDLSQTLPLADRLWLMEKGRGMIAGPTEDLIAQGQVERV